MKKMGLFVLSPCSLPELWYLNFLKKCIFLQYYADLCKKSKSIKAIYIYASERSYYALSENGIVYYAITYCFRDIRIWSQTVFLDFWWVSIFYYILIANISWTVSQTHINHIIFWKRKLRKKTSELGKWPHFFHHSVLTVSFYIWK